MEKAKRKEFLCQFIDLTKGVNVQNVINNMVQQGFEPISICQVSSLAMGSTQQLILVILFKKEEDRID